MKKMLKLTVMTLIMSIVMSFTVSYAGSTKQFKDMPENWTTGSLYRAVANGWIKGDGDKIMPNDNITRAQMAAIIVRAFGATNQADISRFPDVDNSKWYYPEFAAAVYMKAFNGTDEGKLMPDNFITFQECFTVVKNVFNLPEHDESCLTKFIDAKEIADWAKGCMTAVVGGGYWKGINNMLKPKQYITRAEFAVLMDNLITTIITEPGTYKDSLYGNVLIMSDGVTVENLTTDKIVIVADSVTKDVTLKNINSTSNIVLRGGDVKISGKVHNIYAILPYINVDITGVTSRTGTIYIPEGSNVDVGELN